jgi:hypothetical protein
MRTALELPGPGDQRMHSASSTWTRPPLGGATKPVEGTHIASGEDEPGSRDQRWLALLPENDGGEYDRHERHE